MGLVLFRVARILFKKTRRHWLLPSALLCCAPACLFPIPDASARPRFDAWTTDNGLPQNSVNAILQTRDGYLWLATLGGLVRYDGVRFTVFDNFNTEGILSNRFETLFEDADGNLWAGTADGGLTRYRDGTFTTYTTADGLPGNWVSAIESDERGRLWVLTGDRIAQLSDGRFTTSPQENSLPPPPETIQRSSLRKGGMSSYDRAGLHRFTGGRLVTYTTREGLSSLRINSVYQDQRGTLWIGTDDRGLNRLRDGAFTVYTMKDGLPSNDMKVTAACEDGRGNLWFGVADGGLSRLRGGKLTTYTAADGLPSNKITAIYVDREGSIWVGASGKGLYRFREDAVTAYSERDGLSANNIYPVFEDRAGRVWVGAWSGLNRYEGGRFATVRRADGRPFGLVTAFYEDAEGGLWIGTYDSGLTLLKDGQFTDYTPSDGLAADDVLAIHQDREGSFWFGTTAGLSRYRDGRFTTFTTRDGLPGDEVKMIYEDRAGTLWVGVIGGLARFTGERFVAYTEREGLSGQHVRAIHEDTDGVLWVGTYDGGLNRLKGGRFTHYTTREGLFDNGVFRILEDDRGNFWMSSNRGIYRVSRRELNEFAEGNIRLITSTGYGKRDGMLNAECNGGSQPAGWRARDGRLWFPTQEGVAVIDPESEAVRVNPVPPPVLIEELLVNNKPASFRDAVKVRPGEQRLEISFTGLSFIRPESMRFKFKLEGLDADWVDAGAQRKAFYPYVPPGSYTFTVIAANSDGVWNTAGAAVRVVVYPPFWRTWWFLSLVLAGCAALAIFAHKRRVTKLKRAHAAQEAFSRQLIASQENERKRIAGELHDSLGQNLLIIKNRALIGLNAPVEFDRAVKQLDEISSATSQAINEVREIAHDLRPYQLDEFGLTKAILSMLKKVSSSSGINFSSEIDPLDDTFSKEDETNLYRIAQESVNNVVKHSGATEAKVEIKKDAGGVRFLVRDNGSGFIPGATKADKAPSGGLGLASISERARMLGGKYAINSVPGEGTTVVIEIGLRRGQNGS